MSIHKLGENLSITGAHQLGENLSLSGTHKMTYTLDTGLIDTFIKLKNYLTGIGIWAKLDVFHCRIGWSAGELVTNEHIKNQVDGTLNTVTDCTHSNTLGFSANLNTSFINWNWNPFDDGINYKQSDATFFQYYSSSTDLSIFDQFYTLTSDSLQIRRVKIASNPTSISLRINEAGLIDIGSDYVSGLILTSINQSSAGVFFNQEYTQSEASPLGVSSADVLELNKYDTVNSADTKVNVPFSGAGAFLTQSEVTLLNDALTAFFNNVNA